MRCDLQPELENFYIANSEQESLKIFAVNYAPLPLLLVIIVRALPKWKILFLVKFWTTEKTPFYLHTVFSIYAIASLLLFFHSRILCKFRWYAFRYYYYLFQLIDAKLRKCDCTRYHDDDEINSVRFGDCDGSFSLDKFPVRFLVLNFSRSKDYKSNGLRAHFSEIKKNVSHLLAAKMKYFWLNDQRSISHYYLRSIHNMRKKIHKQGKMHANCERWVQMAHNG